MFGFFKNRRRRALREQGLSDEERALIQRRVPYLLRLSPDELEELEGLVRVFLDEKRFEGAGGLTLSDEMRLTIAAQACLLLLNRDTDMYPDLDVIVVYPAAYRAPKLQHHGGVVVEGREVRLGESWTRGVIVLSWADVQRGAANPEDGHNVVLHEFAHQLDAEDGVMDGAPSLDSGAHYRSWAAVLGDEYQELRERLYANKRAVIDAYAAESPQEFFAVVTEHFFEQPDALLEAHPELYAELASFYRQDPAARREPS